MTTGTPQKSEARPQRTQQELDFLAQMERLEGRKLSPQEENLSLEQARHMGELPES